MKGFAYMFENVRLGGKMRYYRLQKDDSACILCSIYANRPIFRLENSELSYGSYILSKGQPNRFIKMCYMARYVGTTPPYFTVSTYIVKGDWPTHRILHTRIVQTLEIITGHRVLKFSPKYSPIDQTKFLRWFVFVGTGRPSVIHYLGPS